MLLTLLMLFLVSQRALAITYYCDWNAPCGCSTSPASISRILGGEQALSSTWGWAVSVLLNNTYYCGGTLISDSWLLTTTDCVGSHPPSEIFVSAATNQLLGWKQWRYTSVVIRHPNYDHQTQVNDIALIKVSSPFNMTDPAIARICLPTTLMNTEDYPLINSPIVTVGWGRVTPNSPGSSTLQQVTLRRVAFESSSCYSQTSNRYLQFCASVENGTKGIYLGDDGGPLMSFTSSQQWVLAGIILYPLGCINPGCSSVHTRVSASLDWIRSMNVTGTFTANVITTSTSTSSTTALPTTTASATIAVFSHTLIALLIITPLSFCTK